MKRKINLFQRNKQAEILDQEKQAKGIFDSFKGKVNIKILFTTSDGVSSAKEFDNVLSAIGLLNMIAEAISKDEKDKIKNGKTTPTLNVVKEDKK